MLRAVGFTDEDFAKPQVGIASTWNMVTPCNMHIDGLARHAGAGADARRREERAVQHDHGLGRHRERHARHALFARVARGHRRLDRDRRRRPKGFDGLVTIGGCDKNMPGCVMAMARLDRPSIFVYGGTIQPGPKNRDIISVFEAVGSYAAGKIDDAELKEVESTAIPGPGSCAGMYTANTMASAIEALGLSLANSSAQEAVSNAKADDCRRAGEAVVALDQARHQAVGHPEQGSVRERDHDRHRARRLDERRAAPARDRARGAGRRSRSPTSRASATARPCSPTCGRAAAT